MPVGATPNGHLYWRCRRGTKELDVLLERYLKRDYPMASARERLAFGRILDLPDPELSDYLFGHAIPEDADLAEIARRIATPGD